MSSTPAVTPSGPPAPARGGLPTLLDRALASASDPAGRVALAGLGLGAAGLVVLFGPNLAHFLHVWSTDENYGHGFLVPIIALYFANEAARGGPATGHAGDRGGVAAGVGLILAAIAGRLATVVVPVGFVGDLAFLLGVAGVVATLFGPRALRRYGFAIGFLVFMIPLPIALYARIAAPLQLAVSRTSTALLNLAGIPALCEGNLITLPGDCTMFVAEACSGMRQLTGFLALTTAWAYLVARPGWYRAVLVASSIPIAATANVVRVTLTGIITYRVDARFASGAFHTAEGVAMIGLGLAILHATCLVLDRLARQGRGRPPSSAPAADRPGEG